MNGTSRKKVLLISSSIILLCMTVIIGMTWALFTDTQKISNHLQAGDLSITLKRISLTKKTLNIQGYLVEEQVQKPDDKPFDFTNPTDQNVFGMTADEKIVPGSKFVAEMQIANYSDVAFGYWIEIVCAKSASSKDLAKQLRVTVNTGTDQSALVSNGLVVTGAGGEYVDVLAVGETGTFTVTVEFLDSSLDTNELGVYDNDLAQNEELDFDLIVHAVQATTAPAP